MSKTPDLAWERIFEYKDTFDVNAEPDKLFGSLSNWSVIRESNGDITMHSPPNIRAHI